MVSKTKYWSQKITDTSRALALEHGVFTWKSAKRIAMSLKQSADKSRNRKGTSYQSAMSMISFYINRSGSNLSTERKRVLNRAKIELKKLYKK